MPLSTTSRRLAAALPALAVLAAAPSAHAATATIIGLKPCYVSVSPDARQQFDGAIAVGFDPNAELEVMVGDTTTPALADSHGTLALSGFPAPYQRRGASSFAVTVSEPGNPSIVAAASSRVTALAVRVRPREASTSDRVRFRGRGFLDDRPIYGHYVLHGKARRTVRFARRPHGACGRFSARRRQIPIRHPRVGRWTLQVDQRHHWWRQPKSPAFRVTIDVQHTIGAH